MKRRTKIYVALLFGLIFATLPLNNASAQLFHEGEVLYYRAAYRAKLVPNTEVGEVTVSTKCDTLNGKEVFRVIGNGRTLPFFRWFFNMNDTYNIWVDKETKRTQRFESDIREDKYTFRSNYRYVWDSMRVHTWSQRRNNTPRTKTMTLTKESMDAVSLYFNLRSVDLESFRAGEHHRLDMVLEDTIRSLRYRFIKRDTIKVPRVGRFATMKFACTIGSSEEFSFTDGTEFFIWITEDENKIPVMLSSPVRVGEVRAYLRSTQGLKYPLSSLIEKK
ncbi:MAG: DUF3108 domain-containing protein [Alistipes sp.]|nr:DUF3108 domain-containing protein [Alistipes sp.]